MKRNSLITLVALALMTVLITAGSRISVTTLAGASAAQTSGGEVLTSTMRDEYVRLAKAKAPESAVKDWAKKHKLEIISLKGFDIVVIRQQIAPKGTRATDVLDPKQYPKGAGFIEMKTSQGLATGLQSTFCPMKKCFWRSDPVGGVILVCLPPGSCSNTGPFIPYAL